MDEHWEWLPLSEAARRIGVTETALTKRRQRGTWDAREDESGAFLFRVPRQEPPEPQEDSDTPRSDNQSDIALYREMVDLLKEELANERESRRRADIIIESLNQRLADALLRIPLPELKPIALPAESSRQEDSGIPQEDKRWWEFWAKR